MTEAPYVERWKIQETGELKYLGRTPLTDHSTVTVGDGEYVNVRGAHTYPMIEYTGELPVPMMFQSEDT